MLTHLCWMEQVKVHMNGDRLPGAEALIVAADVSAGCPKVKPSSDQKKSFPLYIHFRRFGFKVRHWPAPVWMHAKQANGRGPAFTRRTARRRTSPTPGPTRGTSPRRGGAAGAAQRSAGARARAAPPGWPAAAPAWHSAPRPAAPACTRNREAQQFYSGEERRGVCAGPAQSPRVSTRCMCAYPATIIRPAVVPFSACQACQGCGADCMRQTALFTDVHGAQRRCRPLTGGR